MKYLKKISYRHFCFYPEKVTIGEIVNFLNSIKTTNKRNEKKELIKSFYKKNSTKIELLYNITEIINNNYKKNLKQSLKNELSPENKKAENFEKIEKQSESLITTELVNESYLESFKTMNGQILNFEDFIKKLKDIKNETGKNSNETKFILLTNIFSYKLREIDIKYIKDIILNTISIGAAPKTFLDSIKDLLKNDLEIFNKNEINNFEKIFNKKFLENEIELFLGIGPMLPKNMLSYEEFEKEIKKLEKKNKENIFLVEEKFDGERIQIHYERNRGVIFFSRNLENVTKKFSCLIFDLEKFFEDNEIENIILDGEIIGYDYEKKKILDFNFLQSLKNENNIFGNEERLKIYIFDIMLLNSENLLKKDLLYRKKKLEDIFKIENEIISLIKYFIISQKEKNFEKILYKNFKNSKTNNNEGLLIKNISETSYYFPDKRKNWYKLKYFYKKENDSLDLIVIGGYFGKVI